jgi:hypothetical protein
MKKLMSILGIGIILLSASCSKEKDASAQVIRDCTGTYLRLDDKDYLVCNKEELDGFDNGSEVIATFKKVKSCNDGDVAVCMLYHHYEYEVEVKSISSFELQ